MKPAHLHWLLETAVEFPPPLRLFLPSVRTINLNVLEIPEFQSGEYAALIRSAVEDGLIQLFSGEHALDTTDATDAILKYARLSKVTREENVTMHLTALGGLTWEQLAKPQWDRFFLYSVPHPGPIAEDLAAVGVLASKNRDSVLAYLGWLEKLASIDVNWQSLKIQTHPDYPVTYWKRLDGVYEATFEVTQQRTDRIVPESVHSWMLSLSNWHIRPWKRADWLQKE